jgi:hypothetical protein
LVGGKMSWEFEGAPELKRLRKELQRKNDIEFARIIATSGEDAANRFIKVYKKLRGEDVEKDNTYLNDLFCFH